ncbi:DUF2868 domain-containing protein [Marinomonas ostreistagni]|uniref:DUF2868 domain-containing protein n=1 Tax=Marinomonas ostreistagni TaxID=359209 RepID=UPI00194DAF61|nr:DUF2868 domain-containing protein [Marinomonas ostreistagni]MBM6551006.1 DUF2868 domain-containing protein [Marinomonas ostreistagni]
MNDLAEDVGAMPLARQEQSALKASLEQHHPSSLADAGVYDSYTKVVGLGNGLQLLLIGLFTIMGAVAAPISFGSGTDQALNIFWLLVILLGAHLVSLLIWLASLATQSPRGGGQLQWFSLLLDKVGRALRLPKPVLESFIQLRLRGRTGRWLMGRLVHSCWTGYLLGGLCSALLFLMTHQVQFVWETTLLTQQDFYQVSQWLSVLPSMIGAPMPTLSDIQMSQIGVAEQSDSVRQMWGLWLLSCVLLYGVLVRLLFTALSHVLYRSARQSLWQQLVPSAPKARYQSRILDADNTSATTTPTMTQTAVADAAPAPLPQDSRYFLFEWSKAEPTNIEVTARVEDAASQQAYLQDQASDKVLVLDAENSPDRGSLRFIKQAVPSTHTIYLHGQTFVEAWTQALLERGVDAAQIRHWKDV